MDAYFTKIPVGDPVEDTRCSGWLGVLPPTSHSWYQSDW